MVSALDFKHMVVGTLCCPRMSLLLLDTSVVVGFLSCRRIARAVSALHFKQMVLGTLCCPNLHRQVDH